MVGYRAVVFSGACLAVVASGGACTAAAAEQHGKSAKQCNDELKANAAAIEAAHESASAFFHACWWHSASGQKTPIEAAPAPAADDAKAAGPRHPGEHNVSARPARQTPGRQERGFERNVVRVSQPTPFDEPMPPEPVDVGPIGVDAGTGASLPIHPPGVPASLVVGRLPVTVAGVPNAVVLPVLPAYAPLVRELLNNPAVPGLTAAP